MGALYQLGLLFKKNFLLRKRQPGVLVLEVLWPLLVIAVVAIIRQSALPLKKDTCHFQPRAMPSVGVVPFMQSFMCTLDNKCQARDRVVADEEQSYRVAALLGDVTPYLASQDTVDALEVMDTGAKVIVVLKRLTDNATTTQSLGRATVLRNFFRDPDELVRLLTYVHKVMTVEEVEVLLNSSFNVAEFIRMFGFVDFKSVACSSDKLGQYLLFEPGVNVTSVAKALCNIPDSLIPQLTQVIQNQLDVGELVRLVGLFEKLKAQIGGDTDELSEAMMAVADMLELLFRSPSLSSLLTDPAVLKTLPDLIRKLPKWIHSFQNAEDLISQVHDLVTALDPVVTALAPNNSVWESVKYGLELGVEMSVWLQNNASGSSSQLMQRLEGLLANLDLTTNDFSRDFYSIVDAMASLNWTLVGQALMGQATIPHSTVLRWMSSLQEGLKPTSIWNMTSPMLVMADSMAEAASVLLDQFVELERYVFDTMLGDATTKGALVRLLERGPNVTLTVLQAATDPSFLADVFSNPLTFPEVCGRMADRIQAQLGSDVASDIRALVCTSNVTRMVMEFANSTAMQHVFNLIEQTGKRLQMVLGGWQQSGNHSNDMWGLLEDGNFTSLYLHVMSLTQSFSKVANMSQVTWSRLLSDGQMAAILVGREWTTVWDTLTSNFAASSSLALVRSFSMVLADNQTAAALAPTVHMVEVVIRNTDTFMQYYMNMYGQNSPLSRLTEMVTTYMPEVMMAVRSIASNKDVMYRLIGAADPLATFCSERLMTYAVFPGSQALPMAEMETLLCKTDWAAVLTPPNVELAVQEIMAAMDMSGGVTYDVQGDMASINDHVSRMVAMVTDTDALMATLAGPTNLLQHANWSRMAEAVQSMANSLAHPTLQDVLGFSHMTYLTMEQLDRMSPQPESWPFVQYGVLLMDAFVNRSTSYLNASSMQSVLDTLPRSLQDYVGHVSAVTPQLLQVLQQSLLKPEELMTRVLRADLPAPDCNTHFLTDFLVGGASLRATEQYLCQLNWTALAMDLSATDPMSILLSNMIMELSQTGNLSRIEVNWLAVAKRTDSYLSLMNSPVSMDFDWSPFNMTAINASWSGLVQAASALSSLDVERTMQLTTVLQNQLLSLQNQIMAMTAPRIPGVMGLYANLSIDVLSFAIQNLKVINASTEWDVLGWLGSPQLTKAVKTLELLPQLTQVGLDNIVDVMTNPEKVTVWTNPDAWAQVCSNSTAFARLLGLENRPEVDVVALQSGVCSLNLNLTALQEELMASVPGYRDLYNKLAQAFANPSIDSTEYDVDWMRLNSLSTELQALLGSLTVRFPPIKTDMFSSLDWTNGSVYEQQLQQFQQRLQGVLLGLQNTTGSQSWESRLVYTTLSSMATVPGFPRVLQYLHVIVPMIHTSIKNSMRPFSDSLAGLPTLSQLYQQVEQLPDLAEVLSYTALLHPEKLNNLATMTSWEGFCATDPTTFMATPPSSTFDLRSWVSKLCTVNVTVLMSELSRLQGNDQLQQLIAEEMGDPNVVTPPADLEVVAREITDLLQTLTSVTSMTSNPFSVPQMRLFNDVVWNKVMSNILAYANSSMSAIPLEARLVSSTLSGMASIPGFPRVLQYLHVLVPLVEQSLNSSMRPFSESLAGLPTLSQLYQQLQQLPELVDVLAYTAFLHPEKMSNLASVTSWEGFCATDPATFLATPPSSTFDLRSWMSKLCTVNVTVLMSELSRLQGNDQLQQLIAEEMGAVNMTTPPVDAQVVAGEITSLLQRLTSLSSSNMMLPDPGLRILNVSVWEEVQRHIGAYANASSPQFMSAEYYISLLNSLASSSPDMATFLSAFNRGLAIADLMLDSVLRSTQGGNLKDTVAGYPNLQRGLSLVNQAPEVMETFIYTLVFSPEKIAVAAPVMTSFPSFCAADPSTMFTKPPALTFDLNGWVTSLCAMDWNATLDELERLQGTAQIMDLLSGNSTTALDAAAFSNKVQELVTRLSNLTMSTVPAARFLDPAAWQTAVNNVDSWMVNAAQLPLMSGLRVELLQTLTSSDPELQRITNQALALVEVFMDQILNNLQTRSLSDALNGSPTLQSLASLMDELPEVFQTLAYTVIFSPQKLSGLGAVVTSLPVFCTSDLDQVLTVPPSLAWSPSVIQSGLCSLNLTLLNQEVNSLGGSAAVQQILMANSTVQVNATAWNAKLDRLTLVFSGNVTVPAMELPRFFNQTVWEAAMSSLQTYLTNPAQLPAMTAGGVLNFLGGLLTAAPELQQNQNEVNKAFRIAAILLDSSSRYLEGGDLRTMVQGYPTLQSMVQLMDQLPELYQALVYTVFFHPEQLMSKAATLTSWEAFCSSAPTLLATPPSVTWDSALFFRSMCDVNTTLLLTELAQLQGTNAIEQLLAENYTAPVNMTALGKSLDAFVTKLSSAQLPMVTSSFLNASVWEAANNQVARWAQTVNTMSLVSPQALLGMLGMFGNMTAGDGQLLQQALSSMEVAAGVVDVVLDKLLTVENATSVAVQDFFMRSPEFEKLLDLVLTSDGIEVLLWSVDSPKMQQLFAIPNATAALLTLCDPSTSASQWLSAPTGSTVDLDNIRQKLCQIDFEAMGIELAAEFDVDRLMAVMNGNASVNLAALSTKIDRVVAMATRWSTSPPDFRLPPKLLNATFWLNLMEAFNQARTSPEAINAQLRAFLTSAGPLLTQTPFRELGLVLQLLLEQTTENLVALQNATLTLETLASRVPVLRRLFAALGLPASAMEPLLELPVKDPAVLAELFFSPNTSCASGDIWRRLLALPAGYDTSRLQALFCTGNTSRVMADLATEFNAQTLVEALGNATVMPDWEAIMTKAEQLTSAVQALAVSLPTLQDQPTLQRLAALYSNASSTAQIWNFLAPFAAFQTAFQGQPGMSAYFGAMQGGAVMLDWVNRMLGRLLPEGGTLDLASLFRESPTFVKMMDVLFSLQPDVTSAMLNLRPRLEKFEDFVAAMSDPARLETLFCDSSVFQQYFLLPDGFNASLASSALCRLNATALVEELKASVMYPTLKAQFEAIMNGSTTFNISAYVTAQQELTSHIMALLNVSRVTFDGIDLAQSFYVRNMSALMMSLVNALASLPPGSGMPTDPTDYVAQATAVFDSLLKQFAASPDFQYVVASLNFIDLYLRQLKNRVDEINARGFSLAVLLEGTELGKLLPIVLDPVWVEEAANLTLMPVKLQEVLQSPDAATRLCAADLWSVFEGGPLPVLARLQTTACSLNASLVLWQTVFMRANGLQLQQQAAALMEEASLGRAALRTNATQISADVTALIQAVTSLIEQASQSNLTSILGVDVTAFQNVLDRLQTTLMAKIGSLSTQLSSSTMSLLWPMLPNTAEFQQMGRIVNTANLIMDMVNARLQDILDKGLSWSTLLGNSSSLVSLMEAAVTLTQHGLQDWGPGQIDPAKMRQLVADPALLTSLCQGGQAAAFLANGSVPNPLSRDLAAMLCVSVDFQPITNQIMAIWQTNSSVTPDFAAYSQNFQRYSDLVTRLAVTPPRVDPSVSAFNLTALWNQLQALAQDPNKLLGLMKAYGFVFDFLPLDSNTAMMVGATQRALALAQSYLNNLQAAGLDWSRLGRDPLQLLKLVDLATDTQTQTSALRQFYVEPAFMAAGNNAWYKSQVLCQRDNLTRVLGEVPAPQLTVLCYSPPDTWYQTLSQQGFTPTQLFDLATKLAAGIAQFPQCPTCPPGPTMVFSGNASLSSVISSVEELTTTLTSVGTSVAHGFSNMTVAEALETLWLAAGHIFNRTIHSASQLAGTPIGTNSTTVTLTLDRPFVDFLKFAASLGDLVNNWIQKFTGSGATVQLREVLPDSRKLVDLLNSLFGQVTAAEFLTMEVDASKFYNLAFTSQWETVVCSPQQFAATFTFPPGTDVTSLQEALCRATRERRDSLQQLLDMLDAGKVMAQLQTLLAGGSGQVNVPSDLFGRVFNTTSALLNGLQRLGGVNVSTSDAMAWLQPIQDFLMSLGSNPMSSIEMCYGYERYLGNTTLYQSMTPALAWIPWSENQVSSYISLFGVMEDVMCDIFGTLNVSRAVGTLTQAGFWQLLEQSFSQPGPFSCQELGSATTRLSDAINKTVTSLVTSDPNRLAQCFEKAPSTFQTVFNNMDLALKLTSDITDVLREPGVRQLLQHSQDLAPMLDFIINLFRGQQAVIVKLVDAIANSTDVTSYLTNTLKLSPEVINAFLQSTIRLDSAAFIQRPVAEIEQLLCNATLLGNVLTLPPFSPVNITSLVTLLCDARVKETASAIKTASDAAMLVQQALMAATGLQSQDWITNLTSHALGLFQDLESIQALSSIFSSGLDFDLLQKNIPAIDRFLRSGPARIVQGLTAILNDITSGFPGEETKRVAKEIEFFIRGILGLDVIQSRFLSAVRVSDMAKDPNALQQYLMSALGISQQDAAAILSSTYSIRVFLNITQTMLRDDMTCKDIFSDLILLKEGSGVNKDTLTSALCSLSTEAALNVTSTLVPQLNIGDFVQQYVTRSLDEVLRSANVTADDVRRLGSTLSKAQASLSWAARLLKPEAAPPSPNTTAIPTPASTTPSLLDQLINIPQALTGSASLTSLQPVLCGSDQIDLANSSSSSSLTAMIGVRKVTLDEAELNEMPGQFCKDLYREIVSSQLGSIIWAYLKPIMRGKILFTPDTQLSREVMTRATGIFGILEEVRRVSGLWRDNAPGLKQVQAELGNIQELKTALQSDFVSAMVGSLGLDTTSLISSLESLTTSGLSPDRVDALQRAAAMVYNYTQCVELDRLVPTATENDMEAQAFQLGKTNNFLAGVVFMNLPQPSRRKRQAQAQKLPSHVYYKIRMDPENVRTTNRLRSRLWNPSPEGDFADDMRYMRGFVQMQDMVERAIISMQTGTNVSLPGVSLQQFPSPCHHEDAYIRVLGAYLMPVLMTIAWIATIAIATRNLLYDREQGQEETLIIMGMKPKLTWLTWLVSTMLVMSLVSLLITIILKFSSIYRFTEFSIIFLYLVDFAFSIVMMSYMVGAFFTRATVAMLTVLIVYLLSYLPYIVLVSMETQMTFWQKTLACLASTSAFGFSAQYLARMEEQMVGVQWSNINDSPIHDDPMTFSWACWMMLIDAGIYLVIGWYIRNVKPGKYGVGQPWYFFVTPSYWCGPCLKGSTRDPGRMTFPESPLFQDAGREGRVGMAARGLTKKFRSNTVVSNLGLDFMEGQVTALLGHNGAAKTTTMNMLIGVLEPTKGAVAIYGKNVLGSRGDIGFCPQHDALFDFMTVKEHMEFYAGVKTSLFSGSRKKEIRELLLDVDLYSVRHLPVRELSGGMRRRLCVALAFVGGSRAIVLDEPTSGVDPHARSAIWKLIAKHKAGRTILLSTHHLDEADTLSDKTAILHQGHLLAIGSPHFLKDRLAAGYRLTLAKAMPTPENPNDPNSYVYYCNPEAVTNFVRSYIPEAELVLDTATELTFTLPTQQEAGAAAGSASESRTPLYFFFAKLDLNLQKLRVEGYGVTAPTLEEVFLKLTRLADRQVALTPETLETERKKLTDTPSSEDGDGSETSSRTEETSVSVEQPAKRSSRVTGASLKLQQLGALLAKRFHHFRRDWRMLVSLFLLPILFALAGMGFATIRPATQNMTNLLVTPAMYGPNAYVFYKDGSGSALSDDLSRQLYSEPGIGTTCMRNVSVGPPYVCVPPSSSFSEPVVVGANAGCTCEDFVHSCDPEMTRMAPPQRTTRTSDILQRLDNFDIPAYLLDTFESFAERRYGGWSYATPKSANDTDPQVTVWFNNKGYHALPAFLNAHSNNLLRTLVPNNKESYGITLRNHPLAIHEGQLNWETIEQTATDVGIALMILMAFSFIPAALTIYLVQERESKEKQLQFINGVGNGLYWVAALIWDMFIHLLATGLVTAIIAIFRIAPYFDRLNLAAVFVLLALFGWAVIPLMYCTLRAFRRASAAYLVLFCANLFLGIITVVIILVILLFQSNMMAVYDVLRYVFLIFPQFCLAQGMVEVAKNHFVADIFKRFGEDAYRNPFALDIIGWHLVALAIEGLVFFLLALFIESVRGGAIKVSPSLLGGEKEDEEVAAERQRVERGQGQRDVLQVKSLSKVYRRGLGRFLAVDHVSFGVGSGECFGLLGVNGAGKTTTFRMMTGDTLPSSGAAYVGNTKITLGDPRVGADVGYCPQQGGLDPYLTPKELLNIAASLKGLSSEESRQAVQELLTTLELTPHANKAIRQCSGGTQRKVSLAIALLGEPRVLFLDEPTTGMDPATRRLAWRCVRKAVRRGQSVVLTSHNMDECERLCDRLAIMVNGRLVCLGSPQHLKYRFGDGYTVQIQAAGLSDNKFTLENALLSQFPGCAVKVSRKIQDKENNLLELSIPRGVTTVANVFAALEHARENNVLQTYSVSQTTLDTVFITFARAQTDGLGDGVESGSGDTSSEGGSSSEESGKLVGPFANATYAYTNPEFLPEEPSLGFRPQRLNTITEPDGKLSTRL